ncbi:Alpha/Beta hydrolase protein [Phialemonium atrogriseum]|uniref:Alpha/Beta hydrolase protein n=1 Tax=Phialemonium atrogriseum TaxID=1093897 RepID=A0AAJ0C552_9PEZI|nr:Alpha/Beta hydrolase protein [Phialemonium atrogriseum]KAK1768904.1 Alpha/Beta hydrolase protein [Phialemonium atrogriseum]
MDPLYLKTAPPLDPEWLKYEQEAGLNKPRPAYASPLDRQPAYAAECRALSANAMAPGSRDHHLSAAVKTTALTVPSSADGFPIPVLRYEGADSPAPAEGLGASVAVVVVYIHGGGLVVGEADSEDLTCRRIVAELSSSSPELGSVVVFSVGYRLMPAHPAATCVSDCADALAHVVAVARHSDCGGGDDGARPSAKVILVGSSSGGQLAALVSQQQAAGTVNGVVLRCPVTSDAFRGVDGYVPRGLRALHTSASEPSFRNSLLGRMDRAVARDGLERMPLEAPAGLLAGLPRTWVQVCTNDVLYSDGVCYARALRDAGVEVRVDVVRGWPHTFWLKAPHLPRALEAERAMLEGLAWVAG